MNTNNLFLFLIFWSIGLLAWMTLAGIDNSSINLFKEVVESLVAGFLGFIVRDTIDGN